MRIYEQHIQFLPDEHALGLLCGLYRSAFRGRGLEYEDLRQYIPGDDPRILAWAKFAQTRELYSKTFREERDLSVYIVVDPSPSMFWARPNKGDLIVKTAALIAFSAALNRDKVGISIASPQGNGVEIVNATRGSMLHHAACIVQKIHMSGQHAMKKKASLKGCVEALLPHIKQSGAMVFILSDFLSTEEEVISYIGQLRRKSDVIAIRVLDRWDLKPCSLGELPVCDQEGNPIYGPFYKPFTQERAQKLSSMVQRQIAHMEERFLQYNIDIVDIREPLTDLSSEGDVFSPFPAMRQFFCRRAQSRHSRVIR